MAHLCGTTGRAQMHNRCSGMDFEHRQGGDLTLEVKWLLPQAQPLGKRHTRQ
jgi:hypothetical protein